MYYGNWSTLGNQANLVGKGNLQPLKEVGHNVATHAMRNHDGRQLIDLHRQFNPPFHAGKKSITLLQFVWAQPKIVWHRHKGLDVILPLSRKVCHNAFVYGRDCLCGVKIRNVSRT